MGGVGAAGSEYKARAGALTVLTMSSIAPREELLEMLERAPEGGLMRPVDQTYEEMKARYEAELEKFWGGVEGAGGVEGDVGVEDDEGDEGDEDDEGEEGVEGVAEEDEPLYRTTPKGVMGFYADSVLFRWLGNCPAGPLQKSTLSSAAIASLVCCWSATLTHALASEPLTLAELDHVVEPIATRETVEEYLAAMTRIGHVEALSGGGETRYALTDWMREGIAPLAAAARLEVHFPEAVIAPPDILDVEAAFQLAMPLLRLPADLRGACRLGVQIPGGEPLMAGATVEIDRGSVIAVSPLLEEDPQTWATGSPVDWLDTLVDPAAGKIKAGGDTELTDALIVALHDRLFDAPSLRP